MKAYELYLISLLFFTNYLLDIAPSNINDGGNMSDFGAKVCNDVWYSNLLQNTTQFFTISYAGEVC